MKRRLLRLLLSLSTVLVVVVPFLLVEAVLQWRAPLDLIQTRHFDNARRLLEPCPALDRFDDLPADAGLRLAVVGESSGELLGNTLVQLSSRCPAFVTMNCGRGGAALEHVQRDFDAVAATRPDVVLLVFGHNLPFQYPTDRLAMTQASWRERSHLLQAVIPVIAALPPAGDAALRARLLEAFVREAAATARERGFRLVVHTLAANLWLPPVPPLPDEPWRQATWLEATGRRDEALDVLAGAPPDRADLVFLHAVLLARAGRATDAAPLFERALRLDPMLGRARAPETTNALLRRVAAEEHVELRDTARLLASRVPDGLPGWESFVDNVHLRESMRRREAQELLADLVPAASACVERVAPPPPDALQFSAAEHSSALEGPATPTTGQVRWSAALLAERTATLTPEEGGQLVAFVTMQPSSLAQRRLAGAFAEGLFRAGRRDLADACERLDPEPSDAATLIERALRRVATGARADAHDLLEQARRLDPGDVVAQDYLRRLDAEHGAAPAQPREAAPAPSR